MKAPAIKMVTRLDFSEFEPFINVIRSNLEPETEIRCEEHLIRLVRAKIEDKIIQLQNASALDDWTRDLLKHYEVLLECAIKDAMSKT